MTSFLARWAAARRTRRDARLLAGLPARQLRDMGLEPGDARSMEARIRR